MTTPDMATSHISRGDLATEPDITPCQTDEVDSPTKARAPEAPAPPTTVRLHYSRQVDGLRALAVLAVIGFHAELPIHAGYLGVSLFFTISGYLISRQVLDSHHSGGWSWHLFATRRVRRLAPMALVTLATVTAIETVQPLFWGRDDIGGDTIASALHVANWWFISGARGYEGATEIPSPLQHFWSLSVEEQFYLFLPILIMSALVAARRTRFAPRATLLWVFGLGATASAAAGVLTGGEVAYFGTHTRAVELLTGVIAGALAHYGLLAAPAVGRLLGRAVPFGIAILVATWALGPSEVDWLFRGPLVAIAVVGAVVVAAAGTETHSSRWLANGVLVTIGLRSYSLYLVHWPVLLATGPRVLEVSEPVRWLVRAVAMVALTEIGYRYVETPLRRSTSLTGPLLVITYSGALLGLIMFALPTLPTSTPAQTVASAPLTGLPPELASRFDQDGELARLGRRPEMLPNPDSALPIMVLRGDSTARFIGGPLSYFAPEMGYRLINLGAPGCVLGAAVAPGSDSPCPSIVDDRAAASALDPDVTVLVFGPADVHFMAGIDFDQFADQVNSVIDAYTEAGSAVVLVEPWREPSWTTTNGAETEALFTRINEFLADQAAATPGVVTTAGGDIFSGDRQDDRNLRPDGVHVYDQSLGRSVVADTLGPAIGQAAKAAESELE